MDGLNMIKSGTHQWFSIFNILISKEKWISFLKSNGKKFCFFFQTVRGILSALGTGELTAHKELSCTSHKTRLSKNVLYVF